MWILQEKISDKETVGRRVFGSDMSGTKDKPTFGYKLFLDDRLEDDISVDRLGIKAPEIKHHEEITALGNAHGRRRQPPRTFRGWAQIKVSDLSMFKYAVNATPAHEEENKYHAEVSRDGHRTIETARSMAFLLASYASRMPLLEPLQSAACS